MIQPVVQKIRSLIAAIPSVFGLGLLTFLIVTVALPAAPSLPPVTPLVQQVPSAATLLQQGKTLYAAGQFAAAATRWQQAAQQYQTQGDQFNQALSLSYLSLAYQELGQWKPAEAAITQALGLVSTATGTQSAAIRAQILNTQGSLQLASGKTEMALETWKQAENAYHAMGDDVGGFGSQINQAQALQTLGLYRRAKTTLEQINQALQAQPDSLVKATGLRSLGVALQVVGDLRQSQQVLEQSLAMSQSLNVPVETAATLVNLGNTTRALKQFDAALQYYQQAATTVNSGMTKLEAELNQLSLLIDTQKAEAASNLVPQIANDLKQVPLSRAGVYAQVNYAQSLMTLLLANSLTTPSSTDIISVRTIANQLAAAIQQARSLQDPRAESYALGQLGHLYEHTQQWSEAQTLTQQALMIAQSINAADIAYRWQWQLGRLLKQQGEMSKAIVAETEAVKTLQSLRSDLVAINSDIQFSFRESVEPVYRELVALLLRPEHQGDTIPAQNLKQARQVIEALQLAELDNFFREACLEVRPVQIDQVDKTAAVIYPIILPDQLAVILSIPGQPLYYYGTDLPQKQVETTLEQLLQSLNPAFSSQKRLQLSQQVYNWLIKPAETPLAASAIKTLVFVLDGTLRQLPMAALHDGTQYLLEKYSLAVTPGLQLLEPRSLQTKQLKALTAGLTDARQGFVALPGVGIEVQRISAELPSQVLLNQEFSKLNLQNRINATSFPILHLATHGQFSSNPEETFILTWDDKIPVKELETLLKSQERDDRSPIELLVLSACQTAAGDNRATLGLAGIAVRSGARSTVATLWSVQDESTANLMVEFYHQLTQPNVSKAAALRQAQISLLKDSRYSHPFYWAPFVLVGNWL